nr:ankyrin-1-like [Penaeus vannamei]
MLLLDCGCEYDDQNSLGRSPLHIACSENQPEAVEALLRHGASVNVIDKEGVTPLMVAAKIGSAPVVESLLDNGADVNPVDSSKWSAADYARFTNHNQLHQRLKSLMRDGGNSSLIPQGLLNISDEVSTEEEGAVGLTRDRDMDEDGGDSWSDNSDVASIKEKPKINLTKFLPSSDDSGDNIFSSTPEPGSLIGPPKPPRLHASVSSVASEPANENDVETTSNKEEVLVQMILGNHPPRK